MKTFFHDSGPDPPRRSEFGNFFEKILVRAEKERESRGEVVHAKSLAQCGFHIRDAIRNGEGHLLDRCASRLTHVIPADTDAVPEGHILCAKRNDIGNHPHGGAYRENIGPSCNVLFQHVILDGSSKLFRTDAVLSGNRNVHGRKDGRRRVDGHRCAHLIQRD